MGTLRRALSYLLGNELHRLFLTLIEENVNTFINEEAYAKLKEILDNKHEKFPAQESLTLLLKFMNKDSNWQTALRSLMIIHRLVHDKGEEFTEALRATKVKLFADFKRYTSPLRSLVHSTLIPIYTNYIQKLSYNYNSLKICFSKSDIKEELQANDLTLFHFITRIQNTLVYLLKLIPFLETSFIHFDDIQLMKQFTYYVMTDCYNYYQYTNELLDFSLKRIFDLKTNDATFLYEIYCEHIKITKKMKTLFSLRNHIEEFDFQEPSYFIINVEFNKKLEFYMSKLKTDSPTLKTSDIKVIKKAKAEDENETITTEESEHPEKNSISIDDLSKQIFGPSTPQLKKSEIFKPPQLSKLNKKVEVSPQAEEEKEVSELCQIVVHKGQQNTSMPVKQIYFGKKDDISRDASPVRDMESIQVTK